MKPGRRFHIRKTVIDSEISFKGSIIGQDDSGNVDMTTEGYLKSIDSVEVHEDHRSTSAVKVTTLEMESYCGLAGELVRLRGGKRPQAAIIGSVMQQIIPALTVGDFPITKSVIKELKDMRPSINFL